LDGGDIMQLTVELRQHIGTAQTELGPVEVEHNQFIVMASTPFSKHPIHVGYVGKQKGAPFNGLHSFRKLPQELKSAVQRELAKQKSEDTVRMFEPPAPYDEADGLEYTTTRTE